MKIIVHSIRQEFQQGPVKVETPIHDVTSITPSPWGGPDAFTICAGGGSTVHFRVNYIEVFP